MIIYGTNGSKGQTIQTTELCPICKQSQTIVIIPFYRYFHLFWIPFLPIGKKIAIGCEGCGNIINEKNFQLSSEVKSHIKIPKWHFLGLFLVVALFSYLIINDNIETKANEKAIVEYISKPAIGDVYEYYLKETKEYSLMKVVDIKSDTICVVFNEYAATKKNGLSELKKKHSNNYEDYVYEYPKENVFKLVEDKVILKINR